MAFKIRSTVFVYEYPPEGSDAEGVNHLVLTRENLLRPGETIRIRGTISRDPEARTWESAEGQIKIIDAETIGIRWRPSLLDAVASTSLGPERLGVKELRKWGPEREIKGESPLILENTHHSEPRLPEVFTVVDKILIGLLTERTLRRVEGTKRVDRKTELIYEP